MDCDAAAKKHNTLKLKLACTPHVCDSFAKNPDLNPLTGRRISRGAKNGVFAQLEKICNGQLETKRNRLIQALKKHLHPVMNKGESLENRLKLHQVLSNYLKNVSSCIVDGVMKDTETGKPIVTFINQIGTKSKNGQAFLNTGAGMGKLLKFSVKKMSKYDENEIVVLHLLTNIVQRKLSPNFPMMYNATFCDKQNVDALKLPTFKPTVPMKKVAAIIASSIPDKFKKTKTSYYVAMCELADYDLIKWMKTAHTAEEHESILMQMIIALFTLNLMGITHNDAHFGNFLIHHVTPGGFWEYRVGKHTVYVPNMGYLVVIWDFGLSIKNDYGDRIITDFMRALHLYMDDGRIYKVAPLPSSFRELVLTPMEKLFRDNYGFVVSRIIDYILPLVPFQHVKVNGPKPGLILNKTPFKTKIL